MQIRTIVTLLVLGLGVAACGTAEQSETTTTSMPEITTSTVDETPTTTEGATTSTTVGPTTTVESPGDPTPYEAGADPDADEVFALYATLFDSTAGYEEKSVLIDDPTGLEDTVEKYSATGAQVGGVSAQVTAIAINDDSAQVVYTLMFSGNPTYPDQKGTAMRGDSGWLMSRDMFCGVMASARSACPGP